MIDGGVCGMYATHLGLEVFVVGPIGVEPENGEAASGAGARHGELDPVLDWQVLALTHAPDVALLHIVLENLLHVVDTPS